MVSACSSSGPPAAVISRTQRSGSVSTWSAAKLHRPASDAAVGLQPRDQVERLGGRALGLGLLAREALARARATRAPRTAATAARRAARAPRRARLIRRLSSSSSEFVRLSARSAVRMLSSRAWPSRSATSIERRSVRSAPPKRSVSIWPQPSHSAVSSRAGQVRVLEPRVAGLGLGERCVARRPVGLPLGAEPAERRGRDHEREVVGRVGERPSSTSAASRSPSEANAQLDRAAASRASRAPPAPPPPARRRGAGWRPRGGRAAARPGRGRRRASA